MASSKTVNRWHPEEDIELKKLYKSKSVDELAKHFHRSEGSIKSRLTKIKHKSIESLNFQLEEYKNLKKYKAHKNNQKANIMASSITGKLWTTEEDIELKKLYKSKSVDELAEYFNRSEGSIKSRLTKIRHKSIQSLNVQLRDERNQKRYKAYKNDNEASVKSPDRYSSASNASKDQNSAFSFKEYVWFASQILYFIFMIWGGGMEYILAFAIYIIPGNGWEDTYSLYITTFLMLTGAFIINSFFEIFEKGS